MQRLLPFVVCLVLEVATGAALGAEIPASTLKLVPIHAVFLGEQKSGLGGQGLVDPAFVTWINGGGGAVRGVLADRYVAEFKQAFGAGAVDELERSTQRRKAVAASFQILRVSRFAVKKPDGTTQIMLPVTASIYVTSLGSGEVLSAYSKTYVPSKRVDAGVATVADAVWTDLYQDAIATVTQSLIESVKSNFRPHIDTATLRGSWKGLLILDAGKNNGLVESDSLSDETGHTCRIVYSGESYSVCEPASSAPIAVGSVFARESALDATRLKKPRALVVFGNTSQALPPQALAQVFADFAGSNNVPFSVVPVNPMFSQVLTEIDKVTRTSSEDGVFGNRELPNLFVRLNLADPLVYSVKTNLDYVRTRHAMAVVSADIEDANGQVLFSTSGRDLITEDIAHEVGVADADRAESVVKNALLDLAKQVAAGLKLSDDHLALARAGAQPRIADPNGLLVASANYTLFRRVGRIAGIDGDVTVPVAQLRSVSIEGNEVEAKIVAKQDVPAAGDYVLVRHALNNRGPSRNRFAICGDVRGVGDYQTPFIRELLLSHLGSDLAYPYFDPQLPDEATQAVAGAQEFKADLGLQRAVADYCVEPVYRIVADGQKCANGKCVDHVKLAVQFGTTRNDTPVAKDALEAGYSVLQLQADESPAVRAEVIRGELAGLVGGLADQVIVKMNARTY